MIDAEGIYFLTYLGKSELAAAGTSLSSSELELLVLIDGKTTVKQLQARAAHLASDAVIESLDKLLLSEHIALQQFDLGDLFGVSARPEYKAEMPSESAIESGVSMLRENGYMVRIVRRPPSNPKVARGKEFTVLVVEDEKQIAENIRTVLSFAGFLVRIAANREQIVAAFRLAPMPDLVLLDVMLPDADGFNVLASVRQHPILMGVPVIMVTGTATREAVLKGLLGGANGYITKPFQIDVMVKAVKTVLGIETRNHEAGSGWQESRQGTQRAHLAATPAVPGLAPADASIPPPPTPSAPTLAAEFDAFNPSPGSLLARLREAAQAKLKQEQSEKRDPKE